MKFRRFFGYTKKYRNIKDVTKIETPKLTFSQKAADWITLFVGSWTFIIGLSIFMAIWMAVNGMAFVYHWDPYPFILLNFVLSCLAAMQAPIILMSQNRQSEIDRIKSEYDYQVNIKAEKEIQDMQKDLDQIKAMITDLNKKTRK